MTVAPSTTTAKELLHSFDPNEGAEAKGFKIPTMLGKDVGAIDMEAWARLVERQAEQAVPDLYMKTFADLGILGGRDGRARETKVYSYGTSKAVAIPSIQPYGRMSLMPDSAVNGGVIQWPGIAPDALRKVARENIAPQLIIGMRVDDVLRYSEHSTQIWKPGWKIGLKDIKGKVSKHKEDISKAEEFLKNGAIDLKDDDARKRDSLHLSGFQRFLSAATRDSLTYDGIALWTDRAVNGKIKEFGLLPAGNIRLCIPEGYGGNPNLFAVAVDDGGRVVNSFSRDNLTYYVRNPRNDIEVFGYGYPEIEIAIRLIKGFQNALDLNIDIFDRSAVANGILTISGGAITQRQLDLLNRLMTNMKKGTSKAWALPVIGLSQDSKLELLDLSKIKGNEAYYKDFLNMLAGALATIWRFPVRRLGYRISGHGKDTEPASDSGTAMTDEDDPGLAPLLMHIEGLINQYLIWPTWPDLMFGFLGKNPKEDARSYEAKQNARTWAEQRAEAELPDLLDGAESEDEKKLLTLMQHCPGDPNKSGVFQTAIAAMLKSEQDAASEDEGTPGARTQSKKDPAKSEAHGHTSGVTRDSAGERARAA